MFNLRRKNDKCPVEHKSVLDLFGIGEVVGRLPLVFSSIPIDIHKSLSLDDC